MGQFALIMVVWWVPSLVLIAAVTWHRHKAQLRIRRLRLDELFHHQHA
jgi:hypothetical protein